MKKQQPSKGINRVAKRSIRLDTVRAEDYLNYNLPVSCEDCSHFDPESQRCTIGYNARNHLRAEHERTYNLGGRIAFCRFLELD